MSAILNLRGTGEHHRDDRLYIGLSFRSGEYTFVISRGLGQTCSFADCYLSPDDLEAFSAAFSPVQDATIGGLRVRVLPDGGARVSITKGYRGSVTLSAADAAVFGQLLHSFTYEMVPVTTLKLIEDTKRKRERDITMIGMCARPNTGAGTFTEFAPTIVEDLEAMVLARRYEQAHDHWLTRQEEWLNIAPVPSFQTLKPSTKKMLAAMLKRVSDEDDVK